jgi:hypothetical protein
MLIGDDVPLPFNRPRYRAQHASTAVTDIPRRRMPGIHLTHNCTFVMDMPMSLRCAYVTHTLADQLSRPPRHERFMQASARLRSCLCIIRGHLSLDLPEAQHPLA